ncbi:glycoside hydrolase family 16 protein [Pedobacter endophyticus]|uniref:Glycoside hydrolase family 16 protein n=1 Tax=Pedobacter endophyticus TaxID=2789740 RepID=A0A7S9L146_9SPHI|nr:glycoside hydrolase family 16 protein [Pedobacter endophyticus]QPH40569.1 glycoside hydrolase family 16 protein [Pedobacter endophyticus]
MKSLFIWLMLFIPISLTAQPAKQVQTTTSKNKSWKLIFSDDFSAAGKFDENKWSYSPRGNPAWAKFLTPSAEYVFQKSGNLILRMDDRAIDGDKVPYHSGGIQTAEKFNLTYGKVEVRAKFNSGKGSWPAIWMMPEKPLYGNWPASGEIDIMEHVNHEKVVHQTIHNGMVTDAEGGSSATHQASYKENKYNIYSIIWAPDSITFHVNGVHEYTYRRDAPGGSRQWPFDQPFYLILNQSGGAGWPGAIDKLDLPFTMAVDWVRVYKSNGPDTAEK